MRMPDTARKKRRSKRASVNGDHLDNSMEVETVPSKHEEKKPVAKAEVAKKPLEAGEGEPEVGNSDLQVVDCGGRDLISAPLLFTQDGKHVFVSGEDRVTVFNCDTGQPVRELNTGRAIGLGLTSDPAELIVAGTDQIYTWNHHLAKMTHSRKYLKEEKEEGGGVGDGGKTPKRRLKCSVTRAVIPANFSETRELYLSGEARGRKTSSVETDGSAKKQHRGRVYRVRVKGRGDYTEIFGDVAHDTVHVGNNDNCVVVIGHHKVENGSNCQMLIYDKTLSSKHVFNVDRRAPLTVVRCHPTEKIVACGDTEGKVLVVTGFGAQEKVRAAKSVMHWHTCPVRSLSWSLEGGHLYSGGDERVLVKWLPEENSSPQFLPRCGAEILGIEVSSSGMAVQLANNSVKILDRQDLPVQELVGLCRNSAGWPAGLAWNRRSKSLLMNGTTGQVQIFNPQTKDTYSLDITRQNFLSKEREKVPFNSEVEKMCVSEDGMLMVTVDCCWTPVQRILLKFWHFSQSTQEFVLNTQVDCPHKNGVRSVLFRPVGDEGEVSALTVGADKSAKLWVLQEEEDSWGCQFSFQFRGLDCTTAAWSADGSVLAVAFGHVIAVFDKLGRLRTTLSTAKDDGSVGKTDDVVGLVFGQGLNQGSLVSSVTRSGQLLTWDLISLCRIASRSCFTSAISGGVALNVVAHPGTSHLAVVSKDVITLVKPEDGAIIARFNQINCTGGAVYGTYKSDTVLYFLTYDGLIRMVAPQHTSADTSSASAHIISAGGQRHDHFLTAKRSAVVPQEIAADTTASAARRHEDVTALLAVPLHAVPGSSALAASFLANRVRSLPKVRGLSNIAAKEPEHDPDLEHRKLNKTEKLNRTFMRKSAKLGDTQSSSISDENVNIEQFCQLFRSKQDK